MKSRYKKAIETRRINNPRWYKNPELTKSRISKSHMGLHGVRNGMKNTEDQNRKIGLANSITALGNHSALGYRHSEVTKNILREKRALQKFNVVSSQELELRKKLKLQRIKYVPQYPIKIEKVLTIVDIYVPKKNLCIYCDGDYWHNRPEARIRDKKVNNILKNNGYTVLRFWEHEVMTNIELCVEKIKVV